jgi:hypothetical protein
MARAMTVRILSVFDAPRALWFFLRFSFFCSTLWWFRQAFLDGFDRHFLGII